MRESDYYPPEFEREIETQCQNDECPNSQETVLETIEFEVRDYTAYGIWECAACGQENQEEIDLSWD